MSLEEFMSTNTSRNSRIPKSNAKHIKHRRELVINNCVIEASCLRVCPSVNDLLDITVSKQQLDVAKANKLRPISQCADERSHVTTELPPIWKYSVSAKKRDSHGNPVHLHANGSQSQTTKLDSIYNAALRIKRACTDNSEFEMYVLKLIHQFIKRGNGYRIITSQIWSKRAISHEESLRVIECEDERCFTCKVMENISTITSTTTCAKIKNTF
ncbi:hypothetical protein GJ496_003071 [Pomphorhynchus laevis]|nr:hypothetical protein GJ496_003071 [Pomphorhynchus laevis]